MDVNISDTTFWKTWNTLGDLERFFHHLDFTKLSPDQADEAKQLREQIAWRLTNLTPKMQELKENETHC